MLSSRRNSLTTSMADAADSLLLTLEVEAAAARNAELSRTVEDLQAEVQRLQQTPSRVSSSPLPKRPTSLQHFTCASHPSQPPPAPPQLRAGEPREVYLALDDLLFEVADIRSHLPSTTCVDLTPRTFDADSTVTARALRCVAEVKKLKEALIVAQQSTNAQVAELRRALEEQVALRERQQAHCAMQRAVLECRCDELQRQYAEAVARQGEKVLDRVIQSTSTQRNVAKHETNSDSDEVL